MNTFKKLSTSPRSISFIKNTRGTSMITDVANSFCQNESGVCVSGEESHFMLNKGKGAGGKNTNKNGLPYEELTDLKDCYTVIKHNMYEDVVKFHNHEKLFYKTRQSNLFKCMKEHIDHTVTKAHGCKNPDECYINHENKIMYIIEKKFQQVPGSVCEKIQTYDFKLWQYRRTFPNFEIVYIYCLSGWFQDNCKAEIEYFKETNVPVFWGNSKSYKQDIIDFIINYKQ